MRGDIAPKEEAGIEKKKLEVLRYSSPCAFLKRLEINADEKIPKIFSNGNGNPS